MLSCNNYQGFIFDLDGVVWRGKDAVPGGSEVINFLREHGKKIAFLTNNAGEHHRSQHRKLLSMGVEANLDEVITAGSAAALYIKEHHGSSRIFVMGTDDLKQEMIDAGHLSVDINAQFVVVGFDRGFNYEKLNQAYQNIIKGAKFIACNQNPLYPTEHGLKPGVGPSVQALACCSGKTPDIVIGKPHRPIVDITLSRLGLKAKECLVVGDMLDFDIQAGISAGTDTLYVLSGIGKKEDIETLGITPNHILNSIAEMEL